LLNNGWVVRADVPSEVVERFARHLFSLQDEAEGRKLLQAVPVSRFESANDETYQPVRQFLEYFSRSVRSIEQ
jgi:phosphonate transport system substrate-binding protein